MLTDNAIKLALRAAQAFEDGRRSTTNGNKVYWPQDFGLDMSEPNEIAMVYALFTEMFRESIADVEFYEEDGVKVMDVVFHLENCPNVEDDDDDDE
jgi:hypothetical protein